MEAAKKLGAYYTPAALAQPLARWAVRESTDAVLDPSCGEGVFLTCALERLIDLSAEPRRLPDQIAGVEVNARALARARGALLSRSPGLRWGRLAQDDFFLFAAENLGQVRFDAVIGNPPYLRTQGRSESAKRRALDVARRCGAELTADASAWAPFAAAAAGFVRPGGRLALVVPREALFTNYAKPLLSMLERKFARVNLIALDELWFDGALVKVALLLADGVGPGILRLHEARALDSIDALVDAAPVAASSWVGSRIPPDCRAAAARSLDAPELRPLTDVAQALVGVVTGEKRFFLLPEAETRRLGIPGSFFVTALSTPAQLAGTSFVASDAAALGGACRLLHIPKEYAGGCGPLDAYLASGHDQGFDRNYKCRTRKPWYAVRRQLPPPDAFLGYLVKRRPRLVANAAGVHSTNNLHRLYFRAPVPGGAALLAAAALNAATMLSAELLGRIAAGGALKIEPGDAPKIRVIRPEAVAAVKGAADRAAAIDRALREGRDEDAFALADDLAVRATGWDPREVAKLRRAQAALRDARLLR